MLFSNAEPLDIHSLATSSNLLKCRVIAGRTKPSAHDWIEYAGPWLVSEGCIRRLRVIPQS